MTDKLFTPLTIGTMTLPNRIVMAPLTRNRAAEGNVPHDLNVEYYAQRATAGLIITEGTQISARRPGISRLRPVCTVTNRSQAGAQLPDAVHAKGGHIFAQLWHVGRVSHKSLQPWEQPPVAPSAITAKTQVFTTKGFVDASPPRALETEEVARVVEDYRQAAENAKLAGFDGVELHGANGYLVDQFLRDGSNKRKDCYGGSVENRVRFLSEVLAALITVFPASRVGVRFSPFSNFADIDDSNPMATFGAAIARANDFGLGYLHLVEGQTGGSRDLPAGADIQRPAQARSPAPISPTTATTAKAAITAVNSGDADLIAFGRPFIANPDLVNRAGANAPLNEPIQQTFYGGGAEGYTDYPTLDAKAA